MGICEYVLSKNLDNNFLVLTKNERCNGRYSCVSSVTVTVKGLKIKLLKGGQFTVFGISKNAPYTNQGENTPKIMRTCRSLHSTNLTKTFFYVRTDATYSPFM